MALRFTSVSMMLGRIELTRTPVPFKSWARQSMRARAAALDAAYADPPAVWSNAAFDAIFTIDPLFCMTMADAAALATALLAFTFKSTIRGKLLLSVSQ